jgi:hypothetical protein
MTCRIFAALSALAILPLLSTNALAQTSSAAKNPKPASGIWTPPRTPDGQPDLQGNWTNSTVTPLQRPADLAGKEFFTEDEASAFEKKRAPANNQDFFWTDNIHGVKSRRTSIVIDPPDGPIPPMTPEAQKKFDDAHGWNRLHPADGPEDRSLTERCILFGLAGPPMLPEPYNSNYQIVQTPGYVMIMAEMVHDVRVIPLDGRPHLPANVRQWKGDSRGHWEGNTLVVDTTNFAFNDHSRFGVGFDGMSDENFHVIERFTRTDAETITYRATVEDPTVYTKRITFELSMTKRSEPLFEYACHEGNEGMFGILSGARFDEKQETK